MHHSALTAGAVELRNSLQLKFGVELPATVVFDYPTIAALADHIASKLPVVQQHAASLDSPAVLLSECSGSSEISSRSECTGGARETVLITAVAGTIPGASNLPYIAVDSSSSK